MTKFAHHVLLVAHLVGLVVGFGGATCADLLFIRMVRARRTGRTMLLVLRSASNTVLTGYTLLAVSGVGLLFTGSHLTSRVVVKLAVVAIIGLNGWVAHKVTFPRIKAKVIVANELDLIPTVSLDFLHQLSIVAAVSCVSWYMALIIGAWKTTTLAWYVWTVAYLVALLVGVLISLLVTPKLLKVDEPGFEDVFPSLGPSVMRANALYRSPAERTARRALTRGGS